ncbi:DUF4129 domain-containing protein [Candidatus Laterigemmans baculatus]|uniref:DUF4129 domain-containing protein n=1 Tax=Candidatus Laterigemmans baculatus TaxID=2770505 RepID=UPI0013DC2F5A|nr:DUF4129 domain-containing protein [Candidatus Laterigemmans baculatus]
MTPATSLLRFAGLPRLDVCRLARLAVFLLSATAALADEGAGEVAGSVRAGGEPTVAESLESMGRLPWYDSESGEVAPVHVEPRVDDSVNRNSRWLPKPRSTNPTSGQPTSQGTSTAAPTPSGKFSLAEILGWVLVVGLMLLVVGLLVYAFLKIEGTESASASDVAAPEEREQDFQTRLEKLPVEVRRPSGDLLEEADRLAAAGQLDEAIIYLFGHRLLQLDRHHVIRLARGKTNRQYLSEMFGRNELRGIMRETVSVFEASYFGRYEITAERFAEIRASQPTLESLLARLREAA